ncbi:MAG: family 10 glycosylhydrolase [Armatimonadetes bacterium]|nr:family 10 glycosylhydrolase [Armatimonadota bacterium]
MTPIRAAFPIVFLFISITARPDSPPAPVVVIEGDLLGTGGESMAPLAREHFRVMCEALSRARIPFTPTKDTLVAKSGLPRTRVAVLPYNRAVSAAEEAHLLEFLRGGGKLVICMLAPQSLLSVLGVRGNAVAEDRTGQAFSSMRFSLPAIVGLPEKVSQKTPRIRGCAALDGAQVAGWWHGADGTRGAHPAAIVSGHGAFLSAPLSETGDRDAQAALMRALCGHFDAALWSLCIPSSASDIRPLGNYESLAQMRDALINRQRAGEDVSRALAAVRDVEALLGQAGFLLSTGRISEAVKTADAARPQAQKAYWMSYPSVNGELRGVWACNDVPGGWDKAMKTLRASNFNAVFPYFCSAGVAWYPSDYLPRFSGTDYLAQAVDAGRRQGIGVHARMLALYAMCAPKEHLEALQKAGRLCRTASGKTTPWLCPTSPENRRLVRQVALEMVTRYPVEGLQVDYIRLPGESYCLCPRCQAQFRAASGVRAENLAEAVRSGQTRQKFLDWRRKLITDLVREIGDDVMAARPDLLFSAAVFLNWEDHRDAFAQDWKRWVDWGLVDMVCPMNYTPSNDRFSLYVQRQVQWVAKQVPLCPGIGVNADNMDFPGPQRLLDQITIARNMDTDGWVIFNYCDGLVTQYLPYLALGATSTRSAFDPFRRVLAPKPRG